MSRQKPHTSPISILLLIVSIIIIISLIRSAFDFYTARERLVQTKQEVANLETQKKQLEQQMQAIQDPAAVDVAIHDKLNLAKPGETVVVIGGTGHEVQMAPSPRPTPSLQPYQQWWQLLIHPE